MIESANSEFDVIIVGAGPAGCAAAYDLNKNGYKVLLTDRCEFPREKPCAGGISPQAQQLIRYDISPIIRFAPQTVQFTLKRGGEPIQYPTTTLMVERREFDEHCLNKVLSSGVEFRVIDKIDAISNNSTDKHVSLFFKNGQRLTCRFLIGADGSNSLVKRLLFPDIKDQYALAIEGEIDKEILSPFNIYFDFVTRGYGWSFSKGGYYNVGYGVLPTDAEKPTRKKLKEFTTKQFNTDEIRNIRGYPVRIINRNVQPSLALNRAALIGDAAGFADSLFAEGISGAILSGQAAGFAIHQSLLYGGTLEDNYKKNIQHRIDLLKRLNALSESFYTETTVAEEFILYTEMVKFSAYVV